MTVTCECDDCPNRDVKVTVYLPAAELDTAAVQCGACAQWIRPPDEEPAVTEPDGD